jgi:hypothetical protein
MVPLKNNLFLHGVHLLRLQGNALERASQHGQFIGALSAAEKTRLPLVPLSQKNQTLIARALLPHSPLARKFLGRVYETLIQNRAQKLRPEYRAMVKAVLSETGMPADIFWLSLYQPDFLMALAALSTPKVQAKLFEGFPGCTAGALLPDNHSPAFFLRNLDYPLASYWERMPTVFYHEPTDGQKYVNISALGVHTAGLTAWNESGITFSLNAHFSKKVSLSGTPIFFLGDEIIQQAKNLDEAIRICKKFKTIGSWMLLLASFNERKAVAVELSNGEAWVREMDHAPGAGQIAHANAFFCPAFQNDVLHFSGAIQEDSDLRKQRMDALLQKSFEQKSKNPADVLAALGDHLDLATGSTRIFGNTISVVTTVQSSMISPHENCFYLSTRPETPTGLGPYLKLPFAWNELNDEVLQQKPIAPALSYLEDFKRALHEYHLAYVLWHVEHVSPGEVLTHLRRAIEILPHDAHLQMQCGYFELMAGSAERAQRRFADALDEAKCGKLSANAKAVALYFYGACLDLAAPLSPGSREAALRAYQLALATPALDEKLKKKAQFRLKKRFLARDSRKIQPDLQFVEPLTYS